MTKERKRGKKDRYSLSRGSKTKLAEIREKMNCFYGGEEQRRMAHIPHGCTKIGLTCADCEKQECPWGCGGINEQT